MQNRIKKWKYTYPNNTKGGKFMGEKNTFKDIRANGGQSTGSQPQPMSGSKKVKNRNHTRQKNNAGHDM